MQHLIKQWLLFNAVNKPQTTLCNIPILWTAKYIHQKPSARKLNRQIKKQGWTANHPTPEEIRQMWKPASKLSIEGDAH